MSEEIRFVVGLILIQTISGVENFWQVLEPYAVQFFNLYDLETTTETLKPILSICEISEGLGLIFAFYLELFIGIRKVLAFAIVFLSICLYCCLYTVDVNFFI